jgi:nicotinamide riboside kinase
MKRIWLSGSAGTGKTTLAQRLAKELHLPYLEEGMRRRLTNGLNVASLGPEAYDRLLVELFEEQVANENACPQGFVADRSPADFAAFALHYGSFHDRDFTEHFMQRALARLDQPGQILLLPWGALPLHHDGIRSTDRWLQFRFQALVESLITRFAAPHQVLRISPSSQDLEDRLTTSLTWLGHT